MNSAYRGHRLTFCSLEHVLQDPHGDEDYQLVVVACSRRSQFAEARIEKLINRFVNIPVATLSGSWCEGEMRSGNPVPGLIRVYWHQWQGRLDCFFAQLAELGVSSWNLPKIATPADRILFDRKTTNGSWNHQQRLPAPIGVSAMTEEKFLMVADGLGVSDSQVHQQAIWLETVDANDVATTELSVICIECNSITEFLKQRVGAIRIQHPDTSLILIMNFPRQHDIVAARKLGINEVVSKPFNVAELQLAVSNSVCPPKPRRRHKLPA